MSHLRLLPKPFPNGAEMTRKEAARMQMDWYLEQAAAAAQEAATNCVPFVALARTAYQTARKQARR